MLMHADESPPVEVIDMDLAYTYSEYNWSIEYPDIGPAPEWHPDEWLPGEPLMRVEVWGTPEEVPWVHAKTVQVIVPNLDEDGEVFRYAEFEGEPHVTNETFAPERSLDVEVVSKEFEILAD